MSKKEVIRKKYRSLSSKERRAPTPQCWLEGKSTGQNLPGYVFISGVVKTLDHLKKPVWDEYVDATCNREGFVDGRKKNY